MTWKLQSSEACFIKCLCRNAHFPLYIFFPLLLLSTCRNPYISFFPHLMCLLCNQRGGKTPPAGKMPWGNRGKATSLKMHRFPFPENVKTSPQESSFWLPLNLLNSSEPELGDLTPAFLNQRRFQSDYLDFLPNLFVLLQLSLKQQRKEHKRVERKAGKGEKKPNQPWMGNLLLQNCPFSQVLNPWSDIE